MSINCHRRDELYKLFKDDFEIADTVKLVIKNDFESSKVQFLKEKPESPVIFFLGAKATKSFRAALLLCEQGFGPDAFHIVRSLVEIYAAIRFIKETDSATRAAMYCEYEWVLKKKTFDKTDNYLDTHMTPDERSTHRDVINHNFERVCSLYPHFRKARGATGWTGLNIPDLYRKFDLSFYGDVVYTMASHYSHSLPTTASSYFSNSGSGDETWSTGPSADFIDQALPILIEITLFILKEVSNTFGYNVETKIDNILRARSLNKKSTT